MDGPLPTFGDHRAIRFAESLADRGHVHGLARSPGARAAPRSRPAAMTSPAGHVSAPSVSGFFFALLVTLAVTSSVEQHSSVRPRFADVLTSTACLTAA